MNFLKNFEYSHQVFAPLKHKFAHFVTMLYMSDFILLNFSGGAKNCLTPIPEGIGTTFPDIPEGITSEKNGNLYENVSEFRRECGM
jgi:hypothetical protein